MYRYLILFLTLLTSFSLQAQSTTHQDFMRSIGKIYVVVAVLVVTLIGFFYYLIRLDNKIAKLENQIKNHE